MDQAATLMDRPALGNADAKLDIAGLCRPGAEGSVLPTVALERGSRIVCYANPAFCQLVSKPRDQLVGSVFSSAVALSPECLALLDRVFRSGQAETHIGQEDSPADAFAWSYAMWPMVAQDDSVGGVIMQVIETTSTHRQAIAFNQALLIGSLRQHELTSACQESNAELQAEIKERQHAQQNLQRANEDLSNFAFAASHDLQEPLRMITLYTQVLARSYQGPLSEEATVSVDAIVKGATQMRELLADLLSYVQAGGESASVEIIDLNVIFHKATQNLTIAIAESAATVTCDHLPSVCGHGAHFVQLFQNLIGNALKYRGESPPRIHVSVREVNGEWEFAVADNGIGIEPKFHKMIFGVFKRLHGRNISGTGIGLAICHRVVERYGGRIWVESQPDHGSTFYFTVSKETAKTMPSP